MIWREVLGKAVAYLDGKGVPDAGVAAELLIARLLGLGRGFLTGELSKEPSERQLEAMRRAMARLAGGEPLQYVLGEWDFRTLTLKCDRRALIPRPETEGLAGKVIKYLKGKSSLGNPIVVDVGTGTGAIALSLAAEFPAAKYIATDISEEAIALAKENARLTNLADRVSFVVCDGLDDFDEPQSVDVIVSNPPYVKSAVCLELDPRVRDFEPRLALDGGITGLDFYDRYLADAMNLLKPDGAVFFEIGEDQGEDLRRLFESYGFTDIVISKDLSGRDRYAEAVLP